MQYGPRIQAQNILVNIDYKLPFAKLAQLWVDLTGYAYNLATLINAQTTLYQQLLPIEEQVKAQLQAVVICHFDETGIRVKDKVYWLYTACTAFYRYLFVHPKRGQLALNAADSIFEGDAKWLTHD